MKNSWSNVAGVIYLELDSDEDGFICDLQTEIGCGSDALEFLRPYLPMDFDSTPCLELAIHFTSTGYYDPGSMYGGWENLGWAPEGDDERLFESAELLAKGEHVANIPDEIGRRLFDLFEKQISGAELDMND